MRFDRETADAVYRLDLGAFVCAAVPIFDPGADFTPSWHIDALTYALQRMNNRPNRNRLVINLEPRTLKSSIVSICYVAWRLGHNPSLKVMCASYEEGLARKFSRDTRTLMESALYRRVFPATRLNPRKSTETEFETADHGFRFATSVGGSLTGRGADLLIIDDPIKSQDAESEVVRERCNEWFDKTAMSRQQRLGRSQVIVVMQRLHANDLSGVLLERGWPSLILPAIATERQRVPLGGGKYHTRRPGDLLQPNRVNLEGYERLKRENGSRMFAAQYQQDPTPPGGNLIKREWLGRYDAKLTQSQFQQVALACDPAGKAGPDNDFTAIAVAGTRDRKLHLLEVRRGHWTVMEMLAQIAALAARWKASHIIIEDTASGSGLLQLLRLQTKLNAVGKHPTIDKETRLLRQQGAFEASRFVLPPEAPWLADFERELLAFPNGRNDDQVDAVLMLLEWFASHVPGVVLLPPIIIRREASPWNCRTW